MQVSADRIRKAMEMQAQTVTMITAAVDETALAADSMSSTIAAIRADTENVASEIDEVEKSFGEVDEQMAKFKVSAGQLRPELRGLTAPAGRHSGESRDLVNAELLT